MGEVGVRKKMKIELDVESAKPDSVADEAGHDAQVVDPSEINSIYNSPNGFRYVGTILQAKNSPGCKYIHLGDRTYKICT